MNNKNKVFGNKVIVGDMPLAVALRKFKQKVEDSGLLEDVRKKCSTRNQPLSESAKQELPNHVGANNYVINHYLKKCIDKLVKILYNKHIRQVNVLYC